MPRRPGFPDLERKQTYLDRLKRIQRRFIIAASAAYKCTPKEELMKMLGIADVIEELRVLSDARELSAPERRAMKFERRVKAIGRLRSFEVSLRKFSPDEIRAKQVIWCVTNCGPFKSFLIKIGKSLSTESTRSAYYLPAMNTKSG